MENNAYHVPVLLKESVEALQVNNKGIYVDLTFGGGGHTRELLKQGAGRVICFDQDEDVQNNIPQDKRITFVQHNFRYLKYFLRYLNIEKVDGILADLGVSSHEFDEPDRGFSYRYDSRLDMRMNQDALLTAYDVINTYTESELIRIFREYGELSGSRRLAHDIIEARNKLSIETTGDLVSIVEKKVPKYKKMSFLSQVFQAIRIEVNDELGALKEVLEQVSGILKSNGRLAIISYHSLEDRIVKRFMQSGNTAGKIKKDLYGNLLSDFKTVVKMKTPKDIEIERNIRARSAKLRVVERL